MYAMRLSDDADLPALMGAAAREEFETRCTAEANYPLLMDIYRAAIEHRHCSSGNL